MLNKHLPGTVIDPDEGGGGENSAEDKSQWTVGQDETKPTGQLYNIIMHKLCTTWGDISSWDNAAATWPQNHS